MGVHVAEDVVVDGAEEVDVGFYPPIVLGINEGGVVMEEAGIPAAHLVVGYFVGVLDIVFFKDLGGLFVEGLIYPGWGLPVLRRNELKMHLSFSCS